MLPQSFAFDLLRGPQFAILRSFGSLMNRDALPRRKESTSMMLLIPNK